MASSRNQAEQLLTWKKWSVAALAFVLGYIAYLLTHGKTGFFYELVHHVGIFVAAVVAVHFIYELLVKRHERASALEEVRQAVNSTLEALFPSFRQWGFYGFTDDLELKKVFAELEPGDELLWLDTYAPSRHVIGPELEAALKNGARIKMLAVEPGSDVARMRAGEITLPGFSESQFSGDLKLFIETMEAAARSCPANGFELRLYKDLPCVPMYIHCRSGVPIRGLTGYFLNLPSERFAHNRWVHTPGGMLEHFSAYFLNKWNRATPAAKPSPAPRAADRADPGRALPP